MSVEGKGSAPGKVILLGEHSVVYGRPALAAALDRGARASAERAERSRLEVSPWGVSLGVEDDAPLARAFSALLSAAELREPVHVRAEIELPGGAGLGSSAALGVAVLRAIDALFGLPARDAEAQQAIALAWERVFHGNPSGVDTAMAISGGLALYVKGQPIERVHARRALPLVIGESGESASTKAMVDEVARQRARNPERAERTFDAIATLVKNGRLAVEAGDLRALGQLFDLNQQLLAGLMLSTGTLEEMCGAAREAGALGAKLTGGGGGGCMIALAASDEDAAQIAAAIEALGKQARVVRAGGSA